MSNLKSMDLQLSNDVSDVPKACTGLILSIIEVREWINKILWFLKFEETRFQSLLIGIWLSKSLKNLSDHLKIIGSHKGRSQLSPAVFRASRTYVVAQKSSKQFQTPLKLINPYEPGGGFTSLRDIAQFSDQGHFLPSSDTFISVLWGTYINV